MIHLVEKLTPLGWNSKVFTEADYLRICRRERIKNIEYPLVASPGFYMVCAGKKFITLDPRVKGIGRLRVALHELAHFFLHVPPHMNCALFYRLKPDTREEHEADVFSAVCLIPEWKLRRLIETSEDEWDYGITTDMVEFRLTVLDTYGI